MKKQLNAPIILNVLCNVISVSLLKMQVPLIEMTDTLISNDKLQEILIKSKIFQGSSRYCNHPTSLNYEISSDVNATKKHPVMLIIIADR